jgi:arginine/ornithine N-succinyltransferase beta subunit
LTSLPADEATLSARIERALKTWRGELAKSEQGYVFVLEVVETGEVAGICAIEVAVGLNDPWYNYRVGTLVHASKSLTFITRCPRCSSAMTIRAAANFAPYFSTRHGAKRAGYLLLNRVLCLWPLSAL